MEKHLGSTCEFGLLGLRRQWRRANCRMGNTWGDGVNLNNVSMGGPFGINLTAYNNFVRGAGDDGVTINSVNTNGNTMYTEMSNTTLSNNTTVPSGGLMGWASMAGSTTW